MTFAVLVGFHIMFAGIFSGINLYLDFILTPALKNILPGQALTLSDKVGTRVAILTLGSLAGLPVTGFWLLYQYGTLPMLLDFHFFLSGYGAALGLMIFLWTTAMISGLVMMFYLRPRVVVKVPLDTRKDEVDEARDKGVDFATWMTRLATYNAVVSFIVIFIAGFLRYGGLW